MRWDPPRETNPNVIDATFFDEDIGDTGDFLSRIYYMAILPSGTPDTTPPTAPTALSVTARTETSVTLSWTASTDAMGVIGYGVYRNATQVGQTPTTVFTVLNVPCGTTSPFTVDAFDAAGNRSPTAAVTASTLACSDSTAPVTLDNAPPGWSTAAVTVTLSATDVGLRRGEDRVQAGRCRNLEHRHERHGLR